MMRNNAGPYFRCYPADFLRGIAGLNPAQIGVYTFCILWMYNEADAVRLTPAQMGRAISGNAASARRITGELVALGKLIRLPDESLIDDRALMEMIEQAANPRRQIPGRVKARLAAIYDQLETVLEGQVLQNNSKTFAKLIENISKTSGKNPIKTRGPYKRVEDRDQSQIKKYTKKELGEALAAVPEALKPLAAAIIEKHSFDTWGAWFSDAQAEFDGQTLFARSAFTRTKIDQRFAAVLAAQGFTLSREIRPRRPKDTQETQNPQTRAEGGAQQTELMP